MRSDGVQASSSVNLLKSLESGRLQGSIVSNLDFSSNTGIQSENEEELDLLALNNLCGDLIEGTSDEDGDLNLPASPSFKYLSSTKNKKAKTKASRGRKSV